MKTFKKPGLIKMAKKEVVKHSPEILTGIGIAGMITTTILSVKATPKVLDLIEEEKKTKLREATVEEARKWSEEGGIKISPIEYVKLGWKPYLPAAVTGVCSVACLIGANSVHIRRNAALATAYQLSTTALSEYKEKVVETIGEKKEKTIRDSIAKDKIEEIPPSKTEVIVTDTGTSLFFDPLSARYFKSDINTVKKAVNDLNWKMGYGSETYASLSQLYDELGLRHTTISDDIGWNISDGNIELDISAQVTEKGEPCLVLDFLKAPTYDFDRYF